MPSPLTPTPGYRVTVVQYVGARPDARIDCTLCVFSEPIDVPLESMTGAYAYAMSEAIMRAVQDWLAHDCPSRLSDPTTSYPQESPAPERTRNAEGHTRR